MSNNPTTWRRGEREAKVFTNVDGESMVYFVWNDSKVLLHNSHQLTPEAAEELAVTMNTRARLNMAQWTLCFALSEDEENEYFPCGSGVDEWMRNRPAF